MATVEIPRLVARHIGGKTYWTWQPTKYVRRLGFAQKSFGTDRDRAITQSIKLNAQVEAERAKHDQPDSS